MLIFEGLLGNKMEVQDTEIISISLSEYFETDGDGFKQYALDVVWKSQNGVKDFKNVYGGNGSDANNLAAAEAAIPAGSFLPKESTAASVPRVVIYPEHIIYVEKLYLGEDLVPNPNYKMSFHLDGGARMFKYDSDIYTAPTSSADAEALIAALTYLVLPDETVYTNEKKTYINKNKVINHEIENSYKIVFEEECPQDLVTYSAYYYNYKVKFVINCGNKMMKFPSEWFVTTPAAPVWPAIPDDPIGRQDQITNLAAAATTANLVAAEARATLILT